LRWQGRTVAGQVFTIATYASAHTALLHLFLALTLSFASWHRAVPQTNARRFQVDSVRTRIGFQADATLGSFRGTARKVMGWVETSESSFADARGEIVVQAASFHTGIGLRDRHLRETLEVTEHPAIRFVLDSARFEQTDSAGQNWYRLHGQLTIRNVMRTPEIRAHVAARGDTLVVQGTLATRFTDFEMKPPTRMLGTTKVRNEFTITFDCAFVATTPIGELPDDGRPTRRLRWP
jgi:polyisoprenoid-binding protein YceI